MSFTAFIKKTNVEVKRILISGGDVTVAGGQFLNLLKKNMGISSSGTTTSITNSTASSGAGKHIMLTVESEKLIAYVVNTDIFGNPGDYRVNKFDGGDVSDSGSGVSWTFIVDGDIKPASPRLWPFLLFGKADIS